MSPTVHTFGIEQIYEHKPPANKKKTSLGRLAFPWAEPEYKVTVMCVNSHSETIALSVEAFSYNTLTFVADRLDLD